MKVLSLFDGMSCGQIALKRLGIRTETYYASEIDRHAIRQTQLNFPDTIQLGDVTQVDVRQLEPIDLLIGGSPCQSFSFAGKRAGMFTIDKEEIYTLKRYLELKREGFLFEGESYLFWEYMRILTDIRMYNPDVLFLLENVEMGKKWERVLSEAIGIFGVHINSALVSAQNRARIYWTNIRTKKVGLFGELHADIPQPQDRKIFLRHIVEEEADKKYYLSEKMMGWLKRHGEKRNTDMNVLGDNNKSHCLTATAQAKGNLTTNYVCMAMRGRETCLTSRRTEYGKRIRKAYEAGSIAELRKNIQQLEPRTDGKTNCLTSVQKDNLIWAGLAGCRPDRKGKTGTCSQNPLPFGEICMSCGRIRRLTPTECARLQTIPEWYQWKCSDTQQYRMLGNGWTVEVIVHIFSFLKDNIHINIAWQQA